MNSKMCENKFYVHQNVDWNGMFMISLVIKLTNWNQL